LAQLSLSPPLALVTRCRPFRTLSRSASASSSVDDFDVALGFDAVGDVDDVVILEAAHHVGNGIGLADVGEELVAQAFAFGRASHQAGDVDEFHGGGHGALRFDDLGQFACQALVGHCTMPEFGSMVQNGKFSAAMPALVRALNRVDLPTLGRPTMPHLKPI
jgi:hypothetical protein